MESGARVHSDDMTSMPPLKEDSASSSSSLAASDHNKPPSSKSKKKKFGGLFKRKKKPTESPLHRSTNTGSVHSSGSSGGHLGRVVEEEEQSQPPPPPPPRAPTAETQEARRFSSISDEDSVLLVDKYGAVIEEAAPPVIELPVPPRPPVAPPPNEGRRRYYGRKSSKSSQPDDCRSTNNPRAETDSRHSSVSDQALMKRFARRGLPDPSLRHRAWTVLAGVDAIMATREGEYDALVGKSRADMRQIQECLIGGQHRTHWGIIERDLKRTFPHHKLFRDVSVRDVDSDDDDLDGSDVARRYRSEVLPGTGLRPRSDPNVEEGPGRKSLRRVLRAYSVYDEEVGYCQGMNFVAGMFLTFLPEEEAFWLLAVVMNEDPYKLRDLFSKEMTGTHEVLYIADKLVAQFLPSLYEHLENEQVHMSMFVTQWLMTIFTSTFPFTLVARVWDAFLCDGWIVVYRTMLGLLENAQHELLLRNMEQILTFLRSFPNMVDGDAVLVSADRIPVKHYHIQKHISEFRSLMASGELRVEEIYQSRFKGPASIDGFSMASSRTSLPNYNKVHRFVAKLKHARREISVEDLSDKLSPVFGKSKFAVVLSNVLSPEECAGLIKRAKGEQFEDVLMRRSGINGSESTAIASCRRSMVEDLDLASELFDRIATALQGTTLEEKLHHAPWISEGNGSELTATGLNDRLHFLRFGTGQFFAPHRDSRFRRGEETSHITMQVFLNHNFNGGRTSFRGGKRFLDVKPKAGSVLLFDQDLRREECEVLAGRKFMVRSDVMFESAIPEEE